MIDALRREITHKIKEIDNLKVKHEQEKEDMIKQYEKQIEDAIKDTREKVQKVYENR